MYGKSPIDLIGIHKVTTAIIGWNPYFEELYGSVKLTSIINSEDVRSLDIVRIINDERDYRIDVESGYLVDIDIQIIPVAMIARIPNHDDSDLNDNFIFLNRSVVVDEGVVICEVLSEEAYSETAFAFTKHNRYRIILQPYENKRVVTIRPKIILPPYINYRYNESLFITGAELHGGYEFADTSTKINKAMHHTEYLLLFTFPLVTVREHRIPQDVWNNISGQLYNTFYDNKQRG